MISYDIQFSGATIWCGAGNEFINYDEDPDAFIDCAAVYFELKYPVPFVYKNATITATGTATDSPLYVNGFSYGEVVTGTFLLFIFMTIVFASFWFILGGIKIKKQQV